MVLSLKQGKVGNTASDYLPIALTSCLCKLFEKMGCSRLSWLLERSRLLNPVQFGFRRGHSTIDHLVTIDIRVRESFARGHHVGAIFFT